MSTFQEQALAAWTQSRADETRAMLATASKTPLPPNAIHDRRCPCGDGEIRDAYYGGEEIGLCDACGRAFRRSC